MEVNMLYPVYVHVGDAKHAHGVTVPDFPGCYSAADNWDELPAKIQETIEVYCEGEDMDIPGLDVEVARWSGMCGGR